MQQEKHTDTHMHTTMRVVQKVCQVNQKTCASQTLCHRSAQSPATKNALGPVLHWISVAEE